jgi:tetratricopeptide (TPR) repeat protein
MELSREARLAAATVDLNAGRTEAAKAAFARLVKEGAAERMAASQIFAVGGLVGGDEGLICARYLAGGKSPEWRQAGYRLMGSIEEERKSYAAAIDAYRRCLAEDVRTAEAALASLRLGVLESRSAEYARAEATLKEAVKLNASDRARRAEAYAALAANALAQGDRRSARAYATVVVTLFEGSAACAEAERVLKAAGEEGDR